MAEAEKRIQDGMYEAVSTKDQKDGKKLTEAGKATIEYTKAYQESVEKRAEAAKLKTPDLLPQIDSTIEEYKQVSEKFSELNEARANLSLEGGKKAVAKRVAAHLEKVDAVDQQMSQFENDKQKTIRKIKGYLDSIKTVNDIQDEIDQLSDTSLGYNGYRRISPALSTAFDKEEAYMALSQNIDKFNEADE